MSLFRNANPQLRKMFFANPMNPSEQTFQAQYNPTELQGGLGVNYARLSPRGLGHQVLQYSSTDNLSYTVNLFFNASDPEEGDNNTSKQVGRNLEARKFLHSLCYPRRAGNLRSGIGPPRALFVWPGIISMTMVVTALSETLQRFSKTMVPIEFIVAITLEEIRDARILSDEVRATGTERGTGSTGS